MGDLLWAIVTAVPLVLAGLAGVVSKQASKPIQLTALIFVSVYPLPHWYVLRFLRTLLFDLNFKDEAFAASITSVIMMAEFALCPIIFLLTLVVGRVRMGSSRA